MRASEASVRENHKFSATLGFASLVVQVATLASEVVDRLASNPDKHSSLFALHGMLILLSLIVIARSSPCLRSRFAPVKWFAALALFPFAFALREQVSPLITCALPSLGAIIILQRSGRKVLSEIASLAIMFTFIPTLVGYLNGTVDSFPAVFRDVYLSAAISITLLAVALSISDEGLYVTKIFRSKSQTGTFLRRMLFTTTALIVFINWLCLRPPLVNQVDLNFRFALMTLGTLIAAALELLIVSRRMEKLLIDQEAAQNDLRETRARLNAIVHESATKPSAALNV